MPLQSMSPSQFEATLKAIRNLQMYQSSIYVVSEDGKSAPMATDGSIRLDMRVKGLYELKKSQTAEHRRRYVSLVTVVLAAAAAAAAAA